MIEVQVDDVLVRVSAADPRQLAWFGRIVVLKEKDGERVLPIFTGPPEADLLFMRVQGAMPPRPQTDDLMAELVRALGGRVSRVAITSRSDIAFHATVFVAVNGRTEEVDARPTDAILLAVRAGAPVLVDEGVLEEAGVPAGALNERLPPRQLRTEVMAPGEWRRLTSELWRATFRAPKQG